MRYATLWTCLCSFGHAGEAERFNLSVDVLGSAKRLHPILHVGQTHLRAQPNEIPHRASCLIYATGHRIHGGKEAESANPVALGGSTPPLTVCVARTHTQI